MESDFVKSLRKKAIELTQERTALIEELTLGNGRLQQLNGAIGGIDELLKLEGANAANADVEAIVNSALPAIVQLPELLRALMADRRFHEVDDLIKAAKAKGFDFGLKNPRKAVGFTLLGMSRGGEFDRDNAGRWRFKG